MADLKSMSLAQLETHYRGRLKEWSDREGHLQKQLDECNQKVDFYHQKLRMITALASSKPVPPVPTPGPKRRRNRKSPVKTATLAALRNRPGQRLTVRQIITAIRKDSHKRVSRQSVNVNVDKLEKEGLIRRERAPRGTGAQFVFWAV